MGLCGAKIPLLPLPFHDQRQKDWEKSLFLALERLYFPHLLQVLVRIPSGSVHLLSPVKPVSDSKGICLEEHPSCSSPDFPPLSCRHHNCPLLLLCTALGIFPSYNFSNFSFEYCYSILLVGSWSLYFLVLKPLLVDIPLSQFLKLIWSCYLLPFFLMFVWATAGQQLVVHWNSLFLKS